MAMQKKFLQIYRQFGHASSKSFASPAIDSFFTKYPQREVRCCEARRSWWPKPTSDHASTETVLQDSRLCLRNLGVRCHLFKTKNQFLSLAAEEWMSQNFLIGFVSKCLFTQVWYHNSISGHFTPNTKLLQIQRNFMHFVWVFSTPYFVVCTINASIQEQACFIPKQQIVKQFKSFTHITKKSIAILKSCKCFTDLKLVRWLESKRP